MIAFGAVVTFFGRKFLQYTLAALGFIVGTFGSLVLFSLMGLLNGLESDKASIALTVVCFIVAICLGVLLAWLLYKTWKVGALVLGGVAGVFAGITFYNLVLFATESFWLLLTLAVVCGALGVFLAHKFFDLVVILATSLVGAYSFIRGISMFAGGFPNELVLFQQLANNVVPKLGWEFYVYLVAIIILFILGSIFQHRKFKEEDKDGFQRA
jgi:hypothetical protein